MLTIPLFILLVAVAFVFLILGLVYEDAFFGICAGVILMVLSGVMFVNGIYEQTGTNTTTLEINNQTEHIHNPVGPTERIGNWTGNTQVFEEEINTYTPYKDVTTSLIFMILGLSLILKGLFIEG